MAQTSDSFYRFFFLIANVGGTVGKSSLLHVCDTECICNHVI